MPTLASPINTSLQAVNSIIGETCGLESRCHGVLITHLLASELFPALAKTCDVDSSHTCLRIVSPFLLHAR